MAPSPSAVRSRPQGEEQELIAAANAVFGVLELIAETPCSQETEQHVFAATQAANAQLQALGLTCEGLLNPQIYRERGPRGTCSPCSGLVINMAARRAEQSS
jgi:hypothetical protein